MGKKRMSTFAIVLLAVFTAIIAIVIALNFVSGEKKIKQVIDKRYSIDDPQFLRSMGVLLGPAIVPGNHVQTLVNGAEIFPAMLAEIRAAKKSITFETYIYWSGTIGKEFSDALSERARAGVRVFVLLDWAGAAKMEDGYLQNMKDAGVQIEKYHPLRWYNISRMNNRTHRKLLIVDGKIGFTGGVGIADQWNGTAQDKDHWRDTHFKVAGPVVAQMQAAFMDNWTKTRGQVLHGEEFFPALTPVGEDAAQMFKSSPSEGAESMRLMYLLSISAAQKSITLSSAYFVPDDLTIEMLTEAMRRGVRFQVIVPSGKIDTEIVRKASRARWGKLLKAGAEISEYQPTMFHCKVMVVDDLWASVGSTNFDNRSFRLNDEANLNVYNREFALRQQAVFNEDLKKSKRITLEQWQNRPWQEKLIEHTSALLRSQL